MIGLLGVRRRWAEAFLVLLLACGCGPAPQTFHEEHPAAERREGEPRAEERREERHERKERRREERHGRENGARDAGDQNGERPRSNGRAGDEGSGGTGDGASGASAMGAGAYDLERDEQLGGHTLAKHVGKSDEELRERLADEPNISAASTWTDAGTAEAVVGEALRRNAGRITEWEARGERRANLALHYDAGRVIGRSIRHGGAASEPCTSAVVVLKARGADGFYVLTTYPEAGR